MKIAYAAQHGAGGNEDERHVVEALQDLGHTVIEVAQTGSPAGIPKDADLLLFNHWYGVNLSWLKSLPIPKVGWYWDKAWNGREDWLRQVIPLCDLFFMTDETWGRSSGLPNVRYLRQGIGVRGEAQRGKPQPGKWPDIVFTGSPYGERAEWVRVMKSRHGKRFGVVQGVHGRELYDLCETARVVVAPPFPGDDGYDSNRIFLTLGSGGLLIHPKHKWVNREFKDGVHYVGYASQSELDRQIAYFLAHPADRDRVRLTGMRLMHAQFTYKHRVETLLKIWKTSTRTTPAPAKNTGKGG